MKKNIGYVLLGISAAFCFTGVGLLWSGKLDQEKLKSGIDAISIIIFKSIQLLEAEKRLIPIIDVIKLRLAASIEKYDRS